MIDKHDELYADLEAVMEISIIPTILDVVCRTTGMGFAAIARVTEDRWLACCVKDDVQFGLKPGDELKIETTICNEIKDHHEPVIISHVDADEKYRNHHTPKLYGLQSYISFPILLKNGDFFGTLCAIDAKPTRLDDPQISGMFTLFCDLLSFHLQSLLLIRRSHSVLRETNRQLAYANTENLLYQNISDHNLQEPVRKIRLFSNMLVNSSDNPEPAKIKETALKINGFATELAGMIQDISLFSSLSTSKDAFEQVDLNRTLQDTLLELKSKLDENNSKVEAGHLPVVSAIPAQMSALFDKLIDHALSFPADTAPRIVRIRLEQDTVYLNMQEAPLHKIYIEQEGLTADPHSTKNIFDLFLHLDERQNNERYGQGLAHCRRIVHNHGGEISAHAVPGSGLSFCITLPVSSKTP